MNSYLRLLVAGLAAACLAPLQAAVDASVVAADARWVIQADFAALRDSTFGRELVTLSEQSRINLGTAQLGLDVPRVLSTLGTVTAYGTNFSADPRLLDGTLVARGTPELRKIVEGLLLQGTLSSPEAVTEITDLPYPAYLLAARREGGGAAPGGAPAGLFVAFPPEGVVIASKSRAQLLKAREVVRGTAPSAVMAADAPLHGMLKTAPTDAYVFAASYVPPEATVQGDGAPARILQMTESGTLALGEHHQSTFAKGRLYAKTPVLADKLTKIVQGLFAMISLTETTDKQVGEFLTATKVERAENVVKVEVSYPSERVVQMLHTLRQSAEQGRAKAQAAARQAQLVQGDAISEWNATPAPTGPGAPAGAVLTQRIDQVELKTGTVLALGRVSNGGEITPFKSITLTPVAGGTPLTFQTEYLMRGGPRNALRMLQFPGAPGLYRIEVAYVNDRTGKSSYAVSLRHPKAESGATDSAPTP